MVGHHTLRMPPTGALAPARLGLTWDGPQVAPPTAGIATTGSGCSAPLPKWRSRRRPTWRARGTERPARHLPNDHGTPRRPNAHGPARRLPSAGFQGGIGGRDHAGFAVQHAYQSQVGIRQLQPPSNPAWFNAAENGWAGVDGERAGGRDEDGSERCLGARWSPVWRGQSWRRSPRPGWAYVLVREGLTAIVACTTTTALGVDAPVVFR